MGAMLKDKMNCIYLCLNSIYNINSHPNKVTSIASQVTKKATIKSLEASNFSAFANGGFENYYLGTSSWEEKEAATERQMLSGSLMSFFLLVHVRAEV